MTKTKMKSLARLPQLGNIWLGEDKARKILVEMTQAPTRQAPEKRCWYSYPHIPQDVTLEAR